MSELISKLGIDWKLLIAQIVNFLVLAFCPLEIRLRADSRDARKTAEENRKRP